MSVFGDGPRKILEEACEHLEHGHQLAPLLRGADGANHSLLIMKTRDTGIHTGRWRFMVACDTCGLILHAATTGPGWQVARHLEDVGRRKQRDQDILNAVYAGAVTECEETETRIADRIRIHGHHMAQRIVSNVEARLRERGLISGPTVIYVHEPPKAL